jgi:hypothetical protein
LVKNAFSEAGLHNVWHITHFKNLNGIFKTGGLLSHSAVPANAYEDISDHAVQIYRRRNEPVYSRSIHSYVPTYLNPMNPMLYVKKEMFDSLCILRIQMSVVLENEFIFTDGNAASRDTNFYNDPQSVSKLNWDLLHGSTWTDSHLEPHVAKRIRCAELLVYPFIDVKYINGIYSCSSELVERLQRNGLKATYEPRLFFRR